MAQEDFHGCICVAASTMPVPLLISHYRGINRTRQQNTGPVVSHTHSDFGVRQMVQTKWQDLNSWETGQHH